MLAGSIAAVLPAGIERYGRVYRIHFTASDFERSASGMVKVSVPRGKKSGIAIEGGEGLRLDTVRPSTRALRSGVNIPPAHDAISTAGLARPRPFSLD